MKRYTSAAIHRLLCDEFLSEVYLSSEFGCATQALFCPYYVPLEGRLGSDWGVIVNPLSLRFGMLTFEHDDCGCPGGDDRHRDDPNQEGDMWCTEWRHQCDDFCEQPCPEVGTS